jgi:hypothetical protein
MSDDVDRMPEPPDLQKLIELRGGYDKITPQDWLLYYKQAEASAAWLRARHRQVISAKG